MMRISLLVVVPALLLVHACSPVSRARLNRALHATEEAFQDHTGFVLYDLEKKETVFDYNGARYFTPASNTKILTFYSALKILGDSVPALEYVQRNDSLVFWGTGDPSFLNREVFHDSTVYNFLATAANDVYYSGANFHSDHFGRGWAWDDYNSGYSAERSAFPVYGNRVTVVADREILRITPEYFSPHFTGGSQDRETRIVRDLHRNKFVVHPASQLVDVREVSVPFRVDSITFFSLLADTLRRPVYGTRLTKPSFTHTLFSIHVDSLYSVMMQDSDNFIAEQLLLMCANVLSDTLKPEITIDFMTKAFLKDLPDKPVWVDGSGLSRYNLITPRTVVRLWEKIAEEVPRERLFPLLATGGAKGTIRKWYFAEKPYIFGKTGTLSNIHCLSGFLVTRKGRVLVFSFMSSNYTSSTNAIRRNMQSILFDIYDRY